MNASSEGPWDEVLRETHGLDEAIVFRGTVEEGDFEIDIVELRSGVQDPYSDACERAFA